MDWENWFSTLKGIARADGFSDLGVEMAFDKNQQCWRDAFEDGVNPEDAYIEGMDR